MAALIVALYAAGAYFGWETRSHPNDAAWGTGGFARSMVFLATTALFPLVGAVIATRRPGNAVAWPLLAIGLAGSLDAALSTYSVYGVDLHRGPRDLALEAA